MLALAIAALLLFALPARAAPVSITPTLVTLGPGHASALVNITNESDGPTRFETSVNAWSESPEGDTALTPSDEVVVFPQLITLAPHETKKVRIGTELPPSATERSYRLILQELPQLNRDTGRVEIQVLSKISLPVFVANTNAQGRPALSAPALKDGVLSFDIANTGAAHVMVRQIDVVGHDAKGESFTVNTPGWYVLAGGRRSYRVTLSAADCRRSSDIAIKTVSDAGPAEIKVPVTAAACGNATDSRFLKTGAAPS